MRLRLVLCALVAVAASAPAAADVTLRYAPDVEGGRGLVIEADDAGRIRAETSPGQFLYMRDGEIFVVAPAEGTPTVARIDDFVALVEEAGREFQQRGIIHPTTGEGRYRLSDRGPQTVGNWQGTLFVIEQVGPHDADLDYQWVVSRDPDLAALGPIASRVFAAQQRLAAALLGASPTEFSTLLDDPRTRGAILRIVNLYRLESVSNEPVPASRFDLPGRVLSRDQLRQRAAR
jgi:hypothetical protein